MYINLPEFLKYADLTALGAFLPALSVLNKVVFYYETGAEFVKAL